MSHRALEASAEENAARMKRKRCEAQSEMCSPADWIRQDDWPVGIRNVGNTCWFSAVIQVRVNTSRYVCVISVNTKLVVCRSFHLVYLLYGAK